MMDQIWVLIMALILMGCILSMAKGIKPLNVMVASSGICLFWGYQSTFEWIWHIINPNIVSVILLAILGPSLVSGWDINRFRSIVGREGALQSLYVALWVYLLSPWVSNTSLTAAFMKGLQGERPLMHRYLLPISYFSILAGTCSLIGTSSHLLANAWLENVHDQSLGLLSFALVGLCLMAVCLPVVLHYSKKYLSASMAENLQQAVAITNKRMAVELTLPQDSVLIGCKLSDFLKTPSSSIIYSHTIRNGALLAVASKKVKLQFGDRLVFLGSLQAFESHFASSDLISLSKRELDIEQPAIQAMVSTYSSMVDSTLETLKFNKKLDSVVLGIDRKGKPLSGNLYQTKIKAGDILWIAPGGNFSKLSELQYRWFHVIQSSDSLPKQPDQPAKWKVWGIFLSCIATSVFEYIPLVLSLGVSVVMFWFINALNLKKMVKRFNYELWVLMVCALTIAGSIENSGLPEFIINVWDLLFGYLPSALAAYIALAVLIVSAIGLTNYINNLVAMIMILPFSFPLAASIGISPEPLYMAIIFASSCAFILPHGYQTNMMIMSAGNYRPESFAKIGMPVTIAYGLTCWLMIPLIYGL